MPSYYISRGARFGLGGRPSRLGHGGRSSHPSASPYSRSSVITAASLDVGSPGSSLGISFSFMPLFFFGAGTFSFSFLGIVFVMFILSHLLFLLPFLLLWSPSCDFVARCFSCCLF